MGVTKMITRFYYTMAELYGATDNSPITDIGFIQWFNAVLPATIGKATESDETTELFGNYIWPKFYECTIGYIDVEHDPWTAPVKPTREEAITMLSPKCGVIWSWLQGSRKQYEYLIKLYKDEQSNLMKQLGSKSTTLFNDTPQTSDGNDGFITNATTATTSADVGTPMARLKEIRDNIEDLYGSWSREFRKFIIW